MAVPTRHSLFLSALQKESSGDISSLFPHLNMELLTSSERYADAPPQQKRLHATADALPVSLCVRVRSFVVKHRVFLVRNWELVRDRQIRLRINSERDAEAEDTDSQHLSCDGSSGDGSHIKSGP